MNPITVGPASTQRRGSSSSFPYQTLLGEKQVPTQTGALRDKPRAAAQRSEAPVLSLYTSRGWKRIPHYLQQPPRSSMAHPRWDPKREISRDLLSSQPPVSHRLRDGAPSREVAWGGVGGLWPSILATVGKEPEAAAVAQRHANTQSGGCAYPCDSEWRKGAEGTQGGRRGSRRRAASRLLSGAEERSSRTATA